MGYKRVRIKRARAKVRQAKAGVKRAERNLTKQRALRKKAERM